VCVYNVLARWGVEGVALSRQYGDNAIAFSFRLCARDYISI